MKINRGLLARLGSALKGGKTAGESPAQSIAATIHRALATAGLEKPARAPDPGNRRKPLPGARRSPFADVITLRPAAQRTALRPDDSDAGAQVARGEFLSRAFSSDAGARDYKLYLPSSYSSAMSKPVPLIVMLHGCTQSPDDFAAGTRMNALAEQHGFLVAYPAQAANANGSRCWNWFRATDQQRDSGEPALLAGITREIVANYRVDQDRIFVAGLSAGAAMSVILGAVYPDLYAAVGAHSGLPHGAAHDVASAFGAMKGGQATARRARADAAAPTPTIVFHGDADHTVVARNGDAIVEQAAAAVPEEARLSARVSRGGTADGRTYTRTVYTDPGGQSVVEHWLLHGAGHAWSGGSSAGSYTESSGPDASAEMIRFFLRASA